MPQSLPPPPPVLPPIRTMADDMREYARGGPGGGPAPAVPPGGTLKPPAPGLPKVPYRPSAPPIQPVGLPARPSKGVGRRWNVRLLVLGVLGILVLASGAYGVMLLLSRSSASVADAVPAEALAFVSVRGAHPAVADLRSRLADAVGLSADRLTGTTDVTYLLLPGGSAGEPVAALLIRGVKDIDLSGAPGLGLLPSKGGLLIVDSTQLGRLRALSGQTWTKERSVRTLFRGLPTDAPILLGFRPPALAAALQPFLPIPPPFEEPLVLALTPEGGGEVVRVIGRTLGTRAGSSGGGADSTRLLPAGTVFALQRPSAILRTLLEPGRDLPQNLSGVLSLLREQQTAVGELLSLFDSRPFIVGVLATGTPGVRDTVVTIPLKSGADPRALLRALEPVAMAFGPFLTGTSLPDVAFIETTYRDTPIRYVNFGSPARAFDYTVVRDTLLFTTSRESMYALLDTVLEVSPPLASTPPFSLLAGATLGAEWIFLRSDPSLEAELPSAYAIFQTLLEGIVLRPTGEGTLEGSALLGAAGGAPSESAPPAGGAPPQGAPLQVLTPSPETPATPNPSPESEPPGAA